MARFLIVVLPLTGHLYPALAIGQALAAGGHQVAWCGADTDLRPMLGADALIYPTGKRYYRQASSTGEQAARALWQGFLLPFNRFIYQPTEAAVLDFEPDVLVVDQYAVAGALVAHRHGRRWASLCTGAMELTPPSWELPGHQAWVTDQLAQLWTLTGLPADPGLDPRFSPHLVLALTGTALTGTALTGTALPAHYRLVGPALGERPGDDNDAGWPQWDEGRQHLLVTVGTSSDHLAADFYRRMLAALAGLAGRLQAVVIGPPELAAEQPALLASGAVLLADRVPMLRLLPELDAVVCHGGLGTVTEALAFGVPLVVAPIRHDQPAVARQVSEAGAGITVEFDSATPAQLAAAVTAVLDQPGYRQAAGRIAEEFAAAGGAPAAAAELVALAAATA